MHCDEDSGNFVPVRLRIMFFLARKNLFEQPLRLSFSILGIALSVMLILVMWAILEGILGQAGAYVKNTRAQIWVVQKGFTDIAHGFSVVPASLEPVLEELPGVRSADAITGARVEVPTEEGSESLSIIGYNTRDGIVTLAGVDLYGKNERERARIRLERLGLADRKDHRPRDLSGGEKQRVAIARALANHPEVVFADEPTANLDSETGRQVADILCRLGCEESKGVVIVSHDQRLLDIASRVVWIEDGRLGEREEASATPRPRPWWRPRLPLP